MKNKEIEELLNKLEYASECDDFIIEIRKDRAKLLLSYIEQLEKVLNERMDTILKIEKYCIGEKEDLISGSEVCEDVLKFIDISKGDSDE